MAEAHVGDQVLTGALYRHYKGGRYKALLLGSLSEDQETIVVIYLSLSTGRTWVRPLRKEGQDSWTDTVLWPDEVLRPRFILEPVARATPGLREVIRGRE